MVDVLSESAVESVLDLSVLVDVVGEALQKQAAGDVERPERPHFPVGTGLDGPEPEGTGLTMSAYIHGEPYYATKLASVHEDNTERGLPTVNAQIVLTDAKTGQPAAVMGGQTITNARTACIGALAVREFASATETLGVIGAGAQARWQTRAIATVADLTDVRIYSPSESREVCASDLQRRTVPARAVETPAEAVDGADTVVTATTATEPVFPAEALPAGALVVAVGAYTAEMQELPPAVLEQAEAVYADVPAEVAETGDLLATSLEAGDLRAFGGVFGASASNERTVVASVGSATMDAAAAAALYRRARERKTGTAVSLDGT
jgi:alanine dehydrogenase